MARHRSPRGRSATTGSPLRAEPLVRRAAAVRPLLQSAPVRRGAAAVAVTGGAFSLMGVAAPQQFEVAEAAASAQLPVRAPAQAALPDVVMMSAVTPVAQEPDVFDDLAPQVMKAVQMGEELAARLEAERIAAEEAARAEAERAAAEAEEEAEEESAEEESEDAPRAASGGADCGIDTGQLGAVKGHVRHAAEILGCAYGVDTMHGAVGRAGTSDHPSGLAVDFMTDRSAGDGLADCALQNMDALGISYIIWEQRINHGDGWEMVEDRGGVTANHFDHVHISFDGGGGGRPASC